MHPPRVDIDDVDPVLFPHFAWRNIGSDCLAYQRTNRRPHRSNTKPVPNNLIYHGGPVVPVAIDVDRRRVRHQDYVLGLDRRKLLGRRLQYPGMADYHNLRPDRPVADEERGSPATKLIADPRIHRPDLGQQRPVQVNQACRPTGLSLGGDLLRHAVRGATGKSQIGHHQHVDLPARRRCVGPHRLHEHQRLAADNPVGGYAHEQQPNGHRAFTWKCKRPFMERGGRVLGPARTNFNDYVGSVAADDAKAVLDRPSLYELAQIDRDRYTILVVDLNVDGPATVTIYAIDRIEHGVSGNADIVELGQRGGEIPVVQIDLAQQSVDDFIRNAFTRISGRLVTQTFRDQVLVVTESRPLSDLDA